MIDLGDLGLYATLIGGAGLGSTLVAGAASTLHRWVRRTAALLAGLAVVLAALAEIETNLGISLLVVVAAGVVAAVFAGIVADLRTLTALALAAALADILSFLFGPTRFLLERGPGPGGFARYLAVGVESDVGLVLVVGFGDLVFVAVFALALRYLGASWPAAWSAPTMGLWVALGVGMISNGTVGIPLAATTTLLYAHLVLDRGRPTDGDPEARIPPESSRRER